MHIRGLTLATLALAVSAAHADSFSIYNLTNAVTTVGPSDVITGTITFDTTTNMFTSEQINEPFLNAKPFTGPPTRQGFLSNGLYQILFQQPAPAMNISGMDFILLDLPELPGNGVLNLCTMQNPCNLGFNSSSGFMSSNPSINGGSALFLSGQLTLLPTATVTPEPSSLALLATGLLGGAGALRRRIQRRNS